jgi:predicted nucleotidyltransferase component of viral defense system
MSFNADFAPLLVAQEALIERLNSLGDAQFLAAKLCGGTALSRCYLQHRLSYDLDFFFPQGFDAQKLAQAMAKADLSFETHTLVDDPHKANQLHGFALWEGQTVKLSFIEDAYFETFPAVEKSLGKQTVRTERIDGLYHRKLRTVSGSVAAGDEVVGARQTARDLFDLYVLSKVHLPIRAFMASLPYAFPTAAFDNGLVSMPWFELMDELRELVVDEQWRLGADVQELQTHLFNEIGAV